MELYVTQFLLFFVIFARITALIAIAPIFGHQSVPVQVKAGLGTLLSFILYPMISQHPPVVDLQLIPFFILIIREVLVGASAILTRLASE